jgi:Ca-activated chloride channel homolog
MLPSLARAKAKGQRTGAINIGHLEDIAAHVRAASARFITESYDRIDANPFLRVIDNPLSTFSIDVDTASYANVRRFLNMGALPPKDAVRIEELVNYFSYDYPQPKDEHPFAVHIELNACPWNPAHRLARIGLKGKEIAGAERPVCNLVFLIDVSGSMQDMNKLPMVISALELLLDELSAQDRIALVVYAGRSGVVLDSTSAGQRGRIRNALRALNAGGSTNGGEGIERAYQIARANFVRGGVNRVILCTDGDFNVGVTSVAELTRLIEDKAKTGVFLTVLGFGMGNYKDGTLEKLADLGNGNYGYIDSLAEAKKLLVEQASSTLVTIAKDVKIQVEFNPAHASAYRLIGYENRVLRKEDFNNDAKDAGEIGAGHTVTALYEIVPRGTDQLNTSPPVDPLKYQVAISSPPTTNAEMMTVKLRYKLPDGLTSRLIIVPVIDRDQHSGEMSRDFRFASAVASFGMVLRGCEHRGNATFSTVQRLATEGLDGTEYRKEFLEIIKAAKSLSGQQARVDLAE